MSDSTARSGNRSAVTPSENELYRVPARQVPPGLYTLMTRVKSATTQTVTISQATSVKHSGADYGVEIKSRQVTLSAGQWTWVDLYDAQLPSVPLPPNSAAEVQVSIGCDKAIDLDDTYMVSVDSGATVRVDCGTNRHLWMDGPTIENPRPTIWVGPNADKSQARHIEMSKVALWKVMHLVPGRANVYSDTDATDAAIDAAYDRRHRHNAAPIPEEVMP